MTTLKMVIIYNINVIFNFVKFSHYFEYLFVSICDNDTVFCELGEISRDAGCLRA